MGFSIAGNSATSPSAVCEGVRATAAIICCSVMLFIIKHMPAAADSNMLRSGSSGTIVYLLSRSPMANDEHVEIFRRGVSAWNVWRKSNPEIEPDLEEFCFGPSDVIGFDLSGSNLRRADATNVDFKGSNLTSANLREAVLRGADLSAVAGYLLPQQFSGADLTAAKLPVSLQDSLKGLDPAKAISDSAQKLFIAMLAACLYSWLTIATTTDVNLVTNRVSSPLPIIQTSIPIVGFYFVAPFLLLGVYFYFQFYLQKLWDEMGSLPAIFPDGRALQAKADPWLLSDLVRSHASKLRPSLPFISHLQTWISIVLAWWVVPITLLLFWSRYLRRHETIGTVVHCALFAICVTGALSLYRLATRTLRGEICRPFLWKTALRYVGFWKPVASSLATASILALFSLAAIHGERQGTPGRDWWPPNRSVGRWIPAVMEALGSPPFVDLRGADLSSKSPQANGADRQVISLAGADLRYADMRGADARGTVLAGAHLEWADLLAADLTGSELAEASMENTDLLGAHLKSADLSGAKLNGANLRQADLSGVELQYAELRGAQGLTREALMIARNWCNASYDPDVEKMLGLPPDNSERIKAWRNVQNKLSVSDRGAAEAARLEQLSRLFPRVTNETNATLDRLHDVTLDQSPEAEEDQDLQKSLVPIAWPKDMAPASAPMDPPPSPESPLPRADYLVVTWTVGEAAALAAVLSPGYDAKSWYSYRHSFDSEFRDQIAPSAPASLTERLGRYFPIRIGTKRVILFKSDLHFVQDGPKLPLLRLFQNLIYETGAKLVITTGTAGVIGRGLSVGDVVVASRCLLRYKPKRNGSDSDNSTDSEIETRKNSADESDNDSLDGKVVSSAAKVPTKEIQFANMNLLAANASRLSAVRRGMPQVPRIYWNDTPQPAVVVTTNYFAFGDVKNTYGLQCTGSVVESGDALLGLACDQLGATAPKWLSIRNIADPQLSGVADQKRVSRLALVYRRFGFWTTVQSAIATWAVIAGTP
jgi:uncharacterized protein YjbI with pentapeptide repeats